MNQAQRNDNEEVGQNDADNQKVRVRAAREAAAKVAAFNAAAGTYAQRLDSWVKGVPASLPELWSKMTGRSAPDYAGSDRYNGSHPNKN